METDPFATGNSNIGGAHFPNDMTTLQGTNISHQKVSSDKSSTLPAARGYGIVPRRVKCPKFNPVRFDVTRGSIRIYFTNQVAKGQS